MQEIESKRQASEYHTAIALVVSVVQDMAKSDGELPTSDEWRQVRAVVSGALPAPSAAEQSATRARMAATGVASSTKSHGRDGERLRVVSAKP